MKKQIQKPWYLLIAALVIGGYFLLTNIFQLLGYQIIPKLIKFSPKDQNGAMMYVNGVDIVVSVLLLIIVFLVYKKIKQNIGREQTNLTGINTVKCIITGIALAGISFFISFVFSLDSASTAGTTNISKLVMLFVTSVLFAPLIEEFLFRGILFNILSKFREGWIAIILSALIFAVYHADLIQGIFTFIMGIVFTYTYDKTKNIKYPIAIHMANNAFVVIVGYLLPETMRIYANWFSVIMLMSAGSVFVLRRKIRR